MEVRRPVWAEIDLDAIAHNVGQVKNKTRAKIMAIVKANAYGHGAYAVAKTALAAGAERLGVALLAEAIELRDKGITAPIHVLGYTPEESAKLVVEGDIIQTVFSLSQAEALAKAAQGLGKTAKVHIKIDTGMSRIGFGWDKTDQILPLFYLHGLEVEGAFTHLAAADIKEKSFTFEQLDKFVKCIARLESFGVKIAIRHAANSAAIIDVPQAHFEMVRPGIMLYGLAPSQDVDLDSVDLRTAMTFKAEVALVKKLPRGATVSYGRTYRAEGDITVATLPLGYADGYTRLLSNRANVLVKGKRAPIVGRICMDQCMINVTEIPGVAAGDPVVLFGRDGEHVLPVDELANMLGTINYELVCMVSARVPRIYQGSC